MLEKELDEPLPPLLALDFDLGVDAVLTDWETEIHRNIDPDSPKTNVIHLTPENVLEHL